MTRTRRRPPLGQHFLSSFRYPRKIVAALPISPDDLVVEVGPGKGAITGLLAERTTQLVAIEVDRRLANRLEVQFRDRPNVRIRRQDILKTDLAEICGQFQAQGCFLVGNLPYPITSPFLHHAFRFAHCLKGMGLLLQLEVAQRITATPGRKAWGFLSVMAQYYSRPELLWRVPPQAFTPPPKVDSAFVQFDFPGAGVGLNVPDEENFLDFVRSCFREKRKTLVNNLARLFPRSRIQSWLDGAGLSLSVRSEQVGLTQLAALYGALRGD